MKEYKNIERVHTMENGSMNVFLRNGKRVLIEISELNEKFQAAIYGLFAPDLRSEGEKGDAFARFEKHDGYKDCAKEALGWVDENPLEDLPPVEIKERG